MMWTTKQTTPSLHSALSTDAERCAEADVGLRQQRRHHIITSRHHGVVKAAAAAVRDKLAKVSSGLNARNISLSVFRRRHSMHTHTHTH